MTNSGTVTLKVSVSWQGIVASSENITTNSINPGSVGVMLNTPLDQIVNSEALESAPSTKNLFMRTVAPSASEKANEKSI